MNETLKLLYERKSVRVFEDRPISAEDREAILYAAAMAPSAGCQQLYTVLDITDPALKARLAETCDHQAFIAQGRLVLVFLADCRKWYEAFRAVGCGPRKPGTGDLLLACADALIAAQSAVIAAESLGIGSCYIGDILEHCEIHRALFGLPEYVVPAAMVVFGYPTEQQRARRKPRRVAMKHIVQEITYRRMDAAEREELFSARTNGGAYAGSMRAFCARKYNSDFAREMTRSADVYLRDFAAARGEEGEREVPSR